MSNRLNLAERLMNAAASALTLWPLLLAGLGGIGAALWSPLASLPPLSRFLYVVITFTGILWTLLGLIALRREMRPSARRIAFECSHGLGLDGVNLAIDDATTPVGIQLSMVLRNASSVPLKYEVEAIDVIVGTTAILNPQFVSAGGLIPRGCTSLFFYPSFPHTVRQPRVKAAISFSIAYGHPDFGMVRRLKKKLDVSLRLDAKPGIVYLTQSESDDPI